VSAATHLGKDLNTLEKCGEVLFKLRDYTPIPIVIMALLLAKPTAFLFGLGLAVAIFGELTRMYGVAFIGTISRTRSYSNGELVKNGPFSLLRNPLYFGNLVLSVGMAIMSGSLILPMVVVVFFYAQYIPIVAWEEHKLRNIFGAKYADYQKEVPNRWFPSLLRLFSTPWWKEPLDWKPALRSEKRTLTSVICYVILMVGYFYLTTRPDLVTLPFLRPLF
jgi:protein-S-isoprenylcysteine O-methyltransferase Ste14